MPLSLAVPLSLHGGTWGRSSESNFTRRGPAEHTKATDRVSKGLFYDDEFFCRRLTFPEGFTYHGHQPVRTWTRLATNRTMSHWRNDPGRNPFLPTFDWNRNPARGPPGKVGLANRLSPLVINAQCKSWIDSVPSSGEALAFASRTLGVPVVLYF